MENKIPYKGATVEVIRKILMLCPSQGCSDRGNGGIFPKAKAFLCYFENLPLETENGTISTISGFTVTDDPFEKLRDWVESPLEKNDDGWDDTDIFSKSPEEAVSKKIKDLEAIWNESSLHTLCQTCPAKGEQCKKRLTELLKSSNKTPFSFSPFSSP